MTTRIKIKKGAGTPSGLTFGELAYDLTNKKLFIGITGGNALLANTDGGVASFNGLTGAVTGVASIRGLTGAVGITNSTGIGLSVSGQTMTFSNTGVLSIDGGTGAVTNVAKTNVDNNFSSAQTIDGSGAYLEIVGGAGDAFTLTPGVGIVVSDAYNFPQTLRFSQTGTTTTVTLPNYTTTLAGLSGNQTFTALNTFNAGISASGGVTLAGTFSGSTGSFSRLLTASAGISAAGGVTLAGTLQGTTASFTGLVSSAVGFSGAGTNLTGNASGLTAGTATRVITTTTNSASTFYPTFVSGAGNTALFIDPTLGPLSYIPSTATLKTGNLDLGAGALIINSFEVTASNYFYFIASNGIYFQDPTLISIGDVGAAAGKTLFEVYPTVGTRYACLYNSDFANNATLMVNRLSPVGTHAFEVNRSDGKAVKLIYGDTGGAASNYVDLDVSSAGNLTITPSGSLVTITGRLNVSAGISASGATFSAPITSTRMARHTSAAISAVQTASFSPTAAEDGTVFYIDYGGKGMNVTLEGLPIGWRAKFFNTGGGSVNFISTTGSVLGIGMNSSGEFMVEAICITTNTYFVG
jgi:hypothetical protein